MSNQIKLYGSIRIAKATKVFRLYNISDDETSYITLQAGEFYLDHPEASKSIVKILNNLISDACTISLLPNYQLKFYWSDAYYLYIEDTKYAESLAYLMGLYRQGDFKYYIENGFGNDGTTYTNISLACIDFQSGVVFNGSNVQGLPDYKPEFYEATSGVISSLSFANVQKNTIKFSSVLQEYINGDLTYDTNDDISDNTHVFQNTVNNVFNLSFLDSGVLFYLNGTNYQLYINTVLNGDKLKRRVQNWLGLWEFEFDANVVPIDMVGLSGLPDTNIWESHFHMLNTQYLQPPLTVFLRTSFYSLPISLHYLVYIGKADGSYRNFLLAINYDSSFKIYARSAYRNFYGFNLDNILDGKQHNILVSWASNGDVTIYYDDQSQTIATGFTTLYNLGDQWSFMKWRDTYSPMHTGCTTNLSIWDGRNLTPSEVKEVFSNRGIIMQKYKSGLVAHYSFGEGSGQKIYNQVTEDTDTFVGGSWINEN